MDTCEEVSCINVKLTRNVWKFIVPATDSDTRFDLFWNMDRLQRLTHNNKHVYPRMVYTIRWFRVRVLTVRQPSRWTSLRKKRRTLHKGSNVFKAARCTCLQPALRASQVLHYSWTMRTAIHGHDSDYSSWVSADSLPFSFSISSRVVSSRQNRRGWIRYRTTLQRAFFLERDTSSLQIEKIKTGSLINVLHENHWDLEEENTWTRTVVLETSVLRNGGKLLRRGWRGLKNFTSSMQKPGTYR